MPKEVFMFRRVSIRLALFLGDLIIIPIALLVASWLRPYLETGKPIAPEDAWPNIFIYVMAVFIWGGTFSLTDVYNLGKNLRLSDELYRLITAHLVALLAFAGLIYFTFRHLSRLQVVAFALLGLLLLITYRVVFRLFMRLFGNKRYGIRRVLIVGNGSAGRELVDTIALSRWTGLQLIGFVDDSSTSAAMGCPYLGALDETVAVVQNYGINEVIFALPRHAHGQLANLVVALHKLNVNVRIVPDFFDLIFLRSVVEDLGQMPLVTLKEPVLNPLQRLVKRTFDLILGAIGLILSLPLMAIIAVGIKLDSPGPVLFTQERVGENGRIFKMYKFRTMVHNPAQTSPEPATRIINGQPLYKFYDDPRVTRLGRILRGLSLDELPQFINILKGEMSLVGPRPELPFLVSKYQPWQHKRFEVPQGLTGWWQVNGRAENPMHLNTQDDLYYIKHYSLWLDIQILLRTVGAVIKRRGSY